MNGSKRPQDPTEQMCCTCGLWFSKQGIKPHERSCDREEPILPLDRHDEGAGDPGEGATPEAPDPSDGEGVAPSAGGEEAPTPATDGGGAGLGLEGPPETSTPSDDPSASDGAVDEDDQDDDTDDGCPECGTDLEDLEAGRRFRTTQGPVTTDDTDRWCPSCEAIVEESGEVLA